MPVLRLRIDFEGGGRIGPGKVALLEKIAETGSISSGARTMGMSYRRAWDLVDETSRLLGTPVVETRAGGAHGGGAQLTEAGNRLLARFRAMEMAAAKAAQEHIDAMLDLSTGTSS
ncbi:LysR family transcriptional regulator [Mesorhizobium sp. Z1-4]|uniref:winged helix-turn-helix domain-containing protein n=1 Tax=Mesorhizobium sp. Z1-4 TaxID=2448478 RepID=UPI000FD87415|nr:LysR family transcriptional regulator [Mesorhizobium sp. Z1-4]